MIDVESVLTAHHKGHFELKACPIAPGEVPTQSCFDNNKLTFVEDKLYGAPADLLYPERGENLCFVSVVYTITHCIICRPNLTLNLNRTVYSLHPSCRKHTEGSEREL